MPDQTGISLDTMFREMSTSVYVSGVCILKPIDVRGRAFYCQFIPWRIKVNFKGCVVYHYTFPRLEKGFCKYRELRKIPF